MKEKREEDWENDRNSTRARRGRRKEEGGSDWALLFKSSENKRLLCAQCWESEVEPGLRECLTVYTDCIPAMWLQDAFNLYSGNGLNSFLPPPPRCSLRLSTCLCFPSRCLPFTPLMSPVVAQAFLNHTACVCALQGAGSMPVGQPLQMQQGSEAKAWPNWSKLHFTFHWRRMTNPSPCTWWMYT